MPYRLGHVLVRTDCGCQEDELWTMAARVGAIPKRGFDIVPGLWLFSYDSAFEMDEVLDEFLLNEKVQYAEPDYYYHAQMTPNDPLFPQEWGLNNSGQTGGRAGADINAESMWNISTGSSNVAVGIIDTGYDYTHADLIPNLWVNVLEIPGNGIDDDGNGYIDDVHGINAILGTGDPMDNNSHGTHVSGTTGARGNNGIGISGVSQIVQIAGCKFLDQNGTGGTSDAITCLQYYLNLKNRRTSPVNFVVTNNSWGGTGPSSALADAITAHRDAGILFATAAGNSSANNDTGSFYPANFDIANVISVAATDANDGLAYFSNYGRRSVHVGAPGYGIISTVLNQGYASYSGTSMATPHVSGLAAMIKAAFPNLDYKAVKNLVLSSGTPLASLSSTISGRRIRGADSNGTGALTCSNQLVHSRLRPIPNTASVPVGGTLFLSAENINCQTPAGAITLYSDTHQTITLQDNGTNGDQVANDGIYSLLWQPQIAGAYALNFGNGDIVTVTVGSTTQPTYHVSSVPYSYETITGVNLNESDESVVSVTFPFTVPFNGNSAGYNVLYVSSNGTISFTNTANPGPTNQPLPLSSFSTMAALFWDDLTPAAGASNSNVYAAITGSAPNRHAVIEFRNMQNYAWDLGSGTFQAIFYENSPDIQFNYLNTNFGNATYNFGASATVGVQTSTSTATQYSFNSPSVNSQSSLLFHLQ